MHSIAEMGGTVDRTHNSFEWMREKTGWPCNLVQACTQDWQNVMNLAGNKCLIRQSICTNQMSILPTFSQPVKHHDKSCAGFEQRWTSSKCSICSRMFQKWFNGFEDRFKLFHKKACLGEKVKSRLFGNVNRLPYRLFCSNQRNQIAAGSWF